MSSPESSPYQSRTKKDNPTVCLIIACKPNSRPSSDILETSRAKNSHGSGIAWVESGAVRWKKGLVTNKEVAEAIAQVPIDAPLVIHDRLATIGGQCLSLSHPFLVSGADPRRLSGKTKGRVLFHNGHWSDWRTYFLPLLFSKGKAWPKGPISDSRAIAILYDSLGESFLDYLSEQRTCVLSPSGFTIHGNGWSEENGLLFSNLNWKPSKANTWTGFASERWDETAKAWVSIPSLSKSERKELWRKAQEEKRARNLVQLNGPSTGFGDMAVIIGSKTEAKKREEAQGGNSPESLKKTGALERAAERLDSLTDSVVIGDAGPAGLSLEERDEEYERALAEYEKELADWENRQSAWRVPGLE